MLKVYRRPVSVVLLTFISGLLNPPIAIADPPRSVDQTVECELLIVGGGLAVTATAY